MEKNNSDLDKIQVKLSYLMKADKNNKNQQ